MIDVAALTSNGSPAGANLAGATPQGAAFQAAASAAGDIAKALSDSGTATSGISGGVKFGDIGNSSGGGLGLSNKKMITIGVFALAGLVLYGLIFKKGR